MTSRPYGRALAVAASIFVLLSLVPALPRSQTTAPAPRVGLCGSNVTPEEAQRYLEMQQMPQPAPLQLTPPYCVPIAAHIVRTSSGTGGMPMSQLTQAILDANGHFEGIGIAFYLLGVDYIDDNYFYYNIQDINDINALRSTNVVPDAVNVYFTPTLPGLCGISSFTFSSVQGVVMNNGCTGLPTNHTTFSHELGHYFNLFHTHETAYGVEFVDGTNCTSAGDLLCDTPADPNLSGATSNCVYIGGATDPHGDPYDPDVSQLMSYAPPQCPDNFSLQSQARARNTLLSQRTNLLVRGCDPVTPATVSAATPPQGFVDETLDIVLVGTNFRTYTAVMMGDGVTASVVDTLSTNDSLLVSVSVDAAAVPGPRDIIVTNAYDPDTLAAGFEVLDSPRHYVSPAGSAHYPYARPEDAAATLSAAVAAAGAGDSVLVDSTAVVNVSFNVQNAITITGGWDPAFTARDVAAKKTDLTLSGNILVSNTTGTTVIDGFVLHGGWGASDITPINGKYGGAVRVVNSAAVLSRCEMVANDANTGGGFGGGGAVYAGNSSLTIDHCDIHDNTATRGGGVYLYRSTGVITHSTIAANAIQAGGSTAPEGAGLAVHDCPSVTVAATLIDGNTGASNGGGVWISNSPSVTIDGGAVSNHAITGDGAGILASHSTLSLDGVTLAQNQAGFFGGAVSAKDTSSVTALECTITGNTATIGAGLVASGGQAFIRHNLFAGNTAGVTGGGAYVANLTAGEFAGNTLDDNTGTSGVGGVFLAGADIGVFDNIVARSTGDGIGVSGTPPTLSYNLVWASSGNDYSGAAPGPGSLSADPLFVDAAGGDYHLALHSPAIDAGDPDPAYDDPDGSRGDMGRYGSHAFVMDQPSAPQNVATDVAAGQLVVSWDRNPEGDIDFYAVYCDTVSGFTPSALTLVSTTPDTLLSMPAPADTTYYRVSAVDTAGYAGGYSAEVTSLPGTATGTGDAARLVTRLGQNVPNPFNPTTTIEFAIAVPARVELVVYDVAGRRVRTLVGGQRQAKVYRVTWDGTDDRGARVASGIYFYRLTAGAFTQTRKMVLLK